MAKIQQLSASVINKIAAGEVIERPASVVKELVENSVDAGSTRIDVSIEKGGSETIRITDNGCGMGLEDLPLAVTSHATSKITTADDLFSVRTLGFRGEALASIAEISRFTMKSREQGTELGSELEVVGGVAQPIQPVGCPVGTSIEVRNLFFNTPVRHKFLKTTQTEMGHCSEAFTRIALPQSEIHFTLSHNGRVLHDLPPTKNWKERIAAFFGQEIAESLIEIESETEGVKLSGYVANPTHSRGNNRLQYLFLNGRAIKDRSLQHALTEAYRGLLLTGRYPICFMRLELSPEMVDVNVHPSKLEVRFQDSSRLYSQLLGTLRTKFLTTDLVARATPNKTFGTETSGAETSHSAGEQKSDLLDWAKNSLSQKRLDSADESKTLGSGPHTNRSAITSGMYNAAVAGGVQPPQFQPFDDQTVRSFEATPRPSAPNVETSQEEEQPLKKQAIQIHARYLVLESKEGLEIIDQHALHERIIYEEIRGKILAGPLEFQKMLVPEPVDLSSEEAAAVLENKELLASLGLKVEPFGGDTVLISSYPVMLSKLSPKEILFDLVDRLLAGGKLPDKRDLLDELLHMISCKAAVKYGDPLTEEEIEALLAQRHLAQDHHHCPHGRPTTLIFTRDQLDRQFKRI